MQEFEKYKNSRFFKCCVAENIDIDDLASLCGMIQSTYEFHHFDLALKRLSTILSLAVSFNPHLASTYKEFWRPCINRLLPELQRAWFDNAIMHTIPAKQNSVNLLGNLYKDHEYYAALIVHTDDESTEFNLEVALALIMAVKTLPGNKANNLPSTNQLLIIADGLCKATRKPSLWDRVLAELITGEIDDAQLYLENVSQRCRRLNADLSLDYKEGQRNFCRALLACVNSLLAFGDWTHNSPAPCKIQLTPKIPERLAFNDQEDDADVRSIDNLHYPSPKLLSAKPKPSSNFSQTGLAPEDTDQWVTVTYTPAMSADSEALSEAGEKLYGLYNRYFTELDNQYLPIRWSALNRYELDEIIKYLKTASKNQSSPTDKITALLIALTLATGHSLESLLDFRMGTEGDGAIADCRNGLNKVHGYYFWCHAIPLLENRYQPDEADKAYLNPVDDKIVLPLPALICSLLDQCVGAKPLSGSLQEVLSGEVTQLKQAISEQFKTLRMTRRNRSTLARSRNVLFDSLMKVGGDEIAAITVLGLDCDRPISGLYYTTFTVDQLQSLYRGAIDSVFLTNSWAPDVLAIQQSHEVGSLLAISPELMQLTTEKLKDRCEALLKGRRDSNKIIAAHNCYTSYVVMQLMFSTGHRAVNDPFHDPDCFFSNLNAILITDKVELQEHEGRLVWLGDIAQAQYHAYLRHLEGLFSALEKYDGDLAIGGSSLHRLFASKRLPLFFYLTPNGWESVKPTSLSKELGDCWLLPLNSNRHFLSTQLRRLKVPSEYISYQLGHVQIGQLAFGQFSTLAPRMIGQRLIPALSQLEALCGWQVLEGLRPYASKALPEKPAKDWQIQVFGPVLREQKRTKRQQKDSRIVRDALHTVNQSATWAQAEQIPEAFIVRVLAEIEKQSIDEPHALIRRHNLFRRFIKLGRHRKRWHAPIPSLMIEVKGEKAPLTYTDGFDITVLNLIKNQFIRSLSQRFKENVFPPVSSSEKGILVEYFAFCRLSSLLFGQLSNLKYLDGLEKAIADDAQSDRRTVWVNFFNNKTVGTSLKYRWFPDELTVVLIIRIHENLTKDQIKSVPSREISQVVTKLIKQLILQSGIEHVRPNEWLLTRLITCVKKDNALNFPGFVRAFLNGDIESWSLPETAWQRLISGNPLVYQETTASSTPMATDYRSIKMTHASSLAVDKSALKALRLCLQSAQSISSGHNPNPNDTRNESQRRTDLVKQLRQWLRDWQGSCSATLICLHGWIEYLIENGTNHKKHLKISTIYEYLNANATALIEQCRDLHLVELEDDGLFQVYENILNYGKDTSRPYRAARLDEFHSFLVSTFGVAKVDFSELESRDNPYGADANIVTPSEYKRALHLLLQDSFQNEAGQILHALLLCLTYRNGLRTGEVIRLLISDVIIENFSLVYIRNNRYGLCKSINGVRQIPFFNRMDDEELQLLSRWAQHRLQTETDDILAPFFTRSLHNNAIVIRQAVMSRITQALRLATGDPGVKIRHLRHSFATYFTLSAMMDVSSLADLSILQWSGHRGQGREQFTNTLFGQPEPTRRMLYQLANLIGHGNPSTTLRNYIHCLDMLVAKYRPPIPAVMSASEILSILGYSENSMRTVLARLELSATDLQLRNLLPHYLKQIPPQMALDIKSATKSNDMKLSPLPNEPSHFPALDGLAKILVTHNQGADIKTLAQHYFHPPELIELWVNRAIVIQRQTKYDRFKLNPETIQGWGLLEPQEQQRRKDDNENVGLIRKYIDQSFINQIERRLNDSGDTSLPRLVDIWIKTYKQKVTGFYSATQTDAEQLIALLEEFGINRSRIFLEIPANFRENFQSKTGVWQQWLRQQKIPPENIKYSASNVLPNSTKKVIAKPGPGITVSCPKRPQNKSENSPLQIIYFTTEFISYYLFLAAILIKSLD